MATIPILDLKDFENDSVRQKFIKKLGKSLKDIGFFALINHGLSDQEIEEAYKVSEELFALPTDVKMNYSGQKIQGQRGYTAFGKEHAKGSSAPDLKEFWHVGQFEIGDSNYPENIWPAECPRLATVMSTIYQKLEVCSLKLLEACAEYIDEPKHIFRDIATNGNSILRMIHYPPIIGEVAKDSVRAAAHEDINLITLLIEASSSGLEIQQRNGDWMPVVTPKNCIIVDSGDMLQNITNGIYRATTHRVVNPKDPTKSRYSMPYFVHAKSEANLAPLRSCVAAVGSKKYPEINAGEYLQKRLAEIGLRDVRQKP